jgi:hypothetical protein
MQMVRALDAGPMVARSEVPITPHDTAGTLEPRLAEAGSRLLAETLDAGWGAEAEPQDESLAPTRRRSTRRCPARLVAAMVGPGGGCAPTTRGRSPSPLAWRRASIIEASAVGHRIRPGAGHGPAPAPPPEADGNERRSPSRGAAPSRSGLQRPGSVPSAAPSSCAVCVTCWVLDLVNREPPDGEGSSCTQAA